MEIQATIDSLPTGGSTVQFFEGTFKIASGININKSNVVLCGVGHSTIIKVKDSLNADIDYSGISENVIVRDLIIDGNTANQASGFMGGSNLQNMIHAKFINCYIHDIKDIVIYLNNATHSEIENSVI